MMRLYGAALTAASKMLTKKPEKVTKGRTKSGRSLPLSAISQEQEDTGEGKRWENGLRSSEGVRARRWRWWRICRRRQRRRPKTTVAVTTVAAVMFKNYRGEPTGLFTEEKQLRALFAWVNEETSARSPGRPGCGI